MVFLIFKYNGKHKIAEKDEDKRCIYTVTSQQNAANPVFEVHVRSTDGLVTSKSSTSTQFLGQRYNNRRRWDI